MTDGDGRSRHNHGNRKERHTAMEARLEKYARLRDEGLVPWDAAAQVGISQNGSARYERWYKVVKQGKEPGEDKGGNGRWQFFQGR